MQNHTAFSYPKLRYLAEVIPVYAVIPGAFLRESTWGQRFGPEQVNLPFFIDDKCGNLPEQEICLGWMLGSPQLSEKSFLPFSSSTFVMFLLLYGPSCAEERNG